MNFGSFLASSSFPFRPLTRCCTLPVTGSTLLRCSYLQRWSRLKWRSLRWCRRISKGPLVLIEKFFLHTWHQTMCGLWIGSAGPEIKDLVQPILAKNSSRMGTPRCCSRLGRVGPLALVFFLEVASRACSLTSERGMSCLLGSVSSALSSACLLEVPGSGWF